MSDFKKLKTFEYTDKAKEKEKVPLFTVGLHYQKSDSIAEYRLHCPCEKRSNVPGFKCIDGLTKILSTGLQNHSWSLALTS